MKRYVMSKDKIIRLSNEYDDYDAYIDKTSDNLLDLLEVGDCVETVDTIEKFTRIKGIYCFTSGSHLIGVSRIIAIWKRNGDIMRRYSVE